MVRHGRAPPTLPQPLSENHGPEIKDAQCEAPLLAREARARIHGYVVSRRGAQRFLGQTGRFADEVDRELHRHWVNGLDVYGLERAAVAHADAGVSMIHETRGGAGDYPGADTWRLGLHRAGYRLYDSLLKRAAFPA